MKRSPSHILTTDGVLAVVTTTTITDLASPEVVGSAGDQKLVELAQQTFCLFERTEELTLRVVIGEQNTISAMRSADRRTMTAVVVPTGHPVVKSLKRMLRGNLRAVRPSPKPAQSAEPVEPAKPAQHVV
jgi:hypothetical protein